jgi:Flp pilus assembly protein TadD
MYCEHCGKAIGSEAKFCSGCGRPVSKKIQEMESEQVLNELPTMALNETLIKPTREEQEVKQKRPIYRSIWVIPVLSFVFAASTVGGTYAYEEHVTQQVKIDQTKGEELALAGKLSDAKQVLTSILEKRPNDTSVKQDLLAIELGLQIQDKLNSAKQSLGKSKYDDALASIESATSLIDQYQGPFYDGLRKKIADGKSLVTLAQIQYQMKDKKTIEELSPLLSKAEEFNTPEAKQIIANIKNQIADIAYELANEKLQKRDFSGALSEVQQGLTYDDNNQKLLSFKDTITKQQSDFEKAEQERIEQAAIQAAKEDEKNHTAAVQVLSVQNGMDEYGDFKVYGQVKNIGTRAISMIEIFYTVYNKDGKPLGEYSTYVYPNFLNPGDTGSYEDTHYGLSDGSRVQVTRTTWYLN